MNLLSTIGAIIVVIIMIPYMIGWWETGNSAVQQRIIANHMTMVMRAANQYVNQHQDTLLSQATATTGPTISIADLISDGLLPDGFQPQNAWLQDYQIYIRQPQNGALQAIVLTTGGRENATDHFLNAVVPGGAGGHIPSGVLPGQTENMLQGAGNGWVLNLGTVGIASPGAGHLGAVSTYDSSALGQDFLYRVAVPGQPELNAMQTELDMTDHAIRNVSDLQFEPREITSESCTSTDEQGRIFLDSQFAGNHWGLWEHRTDEKRDRGQKRRPHHKAVLCARHRADASDFYRSCNLGSRAGRTANDGYSDLGYLGLGYRMASPPSCTDWRLFPWR